MGFLHNNMNPKMSSIGPKSFCQVAIEFFLNQKILYCLPACLPAWCIQSSIVDIWLQLHLYFFTKKFKIWWRINLLYHTMLVLLSYLLFIIMHQSMFYRWSVKIYYIELPSTCTLHQYMWCCTKLLGYMYRLSAAVGIFTSYCFNSIWTLCNYYSDPVCFIAAL